MKHIVLTSIVALAFAACSDTPDTQLDEAYEGGSEDAVELVEGTPEETVPPTETTPGESDTIEGAIETVTADPSAEISSSDLIEPPVETAAPSEDGVSEESELDTPTEVIGDNLDTAVEDVLPAPEGDLSSPEELLDTENLPDTEDLIDEAGDTLKEKAEEVVEDIEDTETPQ